MNDPSALLIQIAIGDLYGASVIAHGELIYCGLGCNGINVDVSPDDLMLPPVGYQPTIMLYPLPHIIWFN